MFSGKTFLTAIAGEYRIQGGPVVRFTRDGAGLVTRIEGQPTFPLTALASGFTCHIVSSFGSGPFRS